VQPSRWHHSGQRWIASPGQRTADLARFGPESTLAQLGSGVIICFAPGPASFGAVLGDAWKPTDPAIGDFAYRAWHRAETFPDFPAVITANYTLTYRQLVDAAAELALSFRAAATASDRDGIAVLTPLDEFAAIAVLASAIAGCRLVLLDVDEVPDRLAALTTRIDYALFVRVADREVADDLARTAGVDVYVFEPTVSPARSGPLSGDMQMVVTTSGSTSEPKAAILPASRVPTDRDWSTRRCRLIVAGISTYATMNSLSGQIGNGGTSALYDLKRGSTTVMLEFIERCRVTSMSLTPTMMRTFGAIIGDQQINAPLAEVTLRGERVSGTDLAAGHALAPLAVFSHLYASTEAGSIARWHWWPGDPIPDGPLPLGKVRDACRIMLVDPATGSQVEASDQRAEVWTQSEDAFLGYLGAPSDDVIVEFEGQRWVRTGDAASFTADGVLQLHGRSNRRVKIGGQFVEMDEVAQDLEQFAEIEAAAVTSFDDQGTFRLVAHLLPAPQMSVDTVAIRASLAARRPLHTVPSLVRVITGVPPVNQSGKLDHRVLSDWRPSKSAPSPIGQGPPLTGLLSTRLIGLVGEILQLELSADDDLVDVGMNSLEWVELIERVDADFGVQLELSQLFQRPTVRGIAASILDEPTQSALARLTNGTDTPPIVWLVNGLGTYEAIRIARSMSERPTYVVSPAGFHRPGERTIALDAVVNEAVGAISMLPDGHAPVLIGFSSAAHHALATAAHLEAHGCDVPLLVMLDPAAATKSSWKARLHPRSWRPQLANVRRRHRDRRTLDRIEVGHFGLEAASEAFFRERRHAMIRAVSPSYAGPTLVIRTDHFTTPLAMPYLTGQVIERHVSGGHHDVIAKGPEIAGFIEEALGLVDGAPMTMSLR
jgi:surfactin family lipopeptide synthetase A